MVEGPGELATRTKVYVTTGDVLYSKQNNALLAIVEDTFVEGRHDLQKGMCSRKRFELVVQGVAKRVSAEGVDLNPKGPDEIPDHGCWENLIEALRGRGIADEDIPSPFNIFQTMRIEPDGRLLDTTIRPRDGAHLDLRAEIDCLVAISACPESGRGQAVTIQIFAS